MTKNRYTLLRPKKRLCLGHKADLRLPEGNPSLTGFTIKEILEATDGKLISGHPQAITLGISVDSRTIRPGDLFVAIKGRNFDGHDFVKEAIERGKVGAVVSASHVTRFRSHAKNKKNLRRATCDVQHLICVPDTVKALGDIAQHHRRRFKIPIIGVTGSNGKTTTKDMIAHILEKEFRVLRSQGTENNHIGLPLSLLRLNSDYQVVVLEMGMNHLGEIRRLSEIARPNIGVITNVGPAHLEFLGDIKAVARAKTELLEYMEEGDIAILNGDDRNLQSHLGRFRCKVLTFGTNNGYNFFAERIRCRGANLRFLLNSRYSVRLRMLGAYNVYNALASIAASSNLGMAYESMIERLQSFRTLPMRMQRRRLRGIEIIDDCYNSNPQSMYYAIQTLSSLPCRGKKIVVIGDMLELGKSSQRFHTLVGKVAARSGLDMLITVGTLSKKTRDAAIKAGMEKRWVRSCDESCNAAGILLGIVRAGDLILIKGSRLMRMEEIVNRLKVALSN